MIGTAVLCKHAQDSAPIATKGATRHAAVCMMRSALLHAHAKDGALIAQCINSKARQHSACSLRQTPSRV